MNILGLICYQGHSASAALLKNGVVVAAASEERFSRIKEDGAFPKSAIEFVLKQGGLEASDLDGIAFGWNPFLSFKGHIANSVKNLTLSYSYLFQGRSQVYTRSRAARMWDMLNLEREFRRNFGSCPKVEYVDHHLSHASASFFQSGFQEALCFVSDGMAESSSQLGCVFRNGEKETLFETPSPHSLGIFYSAITEYLGFRAEMDEYKVMGLASYGDPNRFLRKTRKLIGFNSSGELRLDQKYFDYLKRGKGFCTEKFSELFGDLSSQSLKADLAAAAQKVLIESFLEQLRLLKKKFPAIPQNFCGSGGVFLNCAMNQALRESGYFSNWYFSPVSGDLGVCIGSAQYLSFKKTGELPTPVKDFGLGPEYTDLEIESALRANPVVSFSRVEDPEKTCAKLLSESKIVARFQGRTEFGPRALGFRSILGDPRVRETREILNEKIKSRETFRPFGPSVLREKFGEYFVSENAATEFPYMIETVSVRPEQAKRIPAVIHNDGTSRIQTVQREENPQYHRLLEHFDQLTGVPMVLNTSFNCKDEPIVNSPSQAIDCFLKCKLDALVIGNYLVQRS